MEAAKAQNWAVEPQKKDVSIIYSCLSYCFLKYVKSSSLFDLVIFFILYTLNESNGSLL
jgi:hypothetical protein